MTDSRKACVLAAITARFPGTHIEIEPNRDPATWDAIPDWVWILDAPADALHEVHSFALDVAFAVYGDDLIPMMFAPLDPVQTAKHHPRPAASGQVSES
jgi:hypothetical protein